MEQAACLGMDTEIFFPHDGRADQARAAKNVCAVCPVIEPCLAYALTIDGAYFEGVFGGTTANERRRMRRGDAA